MKRLLMVLSMVALAATVFTPAAEADDPDVPGSGDACGTSEPVTPVVAGTLDPSDPSDWYDASFASGSQTLEVRVVASPLNPFGSTFSNGVELNIFEWDTTNDTCVQIDTVQCLIVFSGTNSCQPGEHEGFATYTFPSPGDYQVSVTQPSHLVGTVGQIPYLINEAVA